jgi:hypothetical protein
VISNIVSDGPDLLDDEIYLIFSFEWQHEDAQTGSAREKELIEGYRNREKAGRGFTD